MKISPKTYSQKKLIIVCVVCKLNLFLFARQCAADLLVSEAPFRIFV